MTSKELTIEKDNCKTILDVSINLKESLEEKIVVQQYLGVIKKIEDEKKYQKFCTQKGFMPLQFRCIRAIQV